MRKRLLASLAVVALIASSAGTATADIPRRNSRKTQSDSALQTTKRLLGLDALKGRQHGGREGHLPGARENVRLISKLRLTKVEGGIADVHYYKGFAYLSAWAPECPKGGVHVVDVRRPNKPKRVGFIPAGPDDYVGEGVHAIHIDNRWFEGDVLLVNHEGCGPEFKEGISLWDITKPGAPKPLALHTGDFETDGQSFPTANSVHSVLGWTAGHKAYAVYSDNYEAGVTDVDIMDISNPRKPKLVSETGLPDWPEAQEPLARGGQAFHHDVWAKKIGGNWVLGVSYWDAGWVFLNVDDPTNPRFIYDTDYPAEDLLGFSPEGNAHQGEWNYNARYWLGTDEDFSPYRIEPFEITTGPNAGEYEAGEFGFSVPIAQKFSDQQINGPTILGGLGCPSNDEYGDQPPIPDASELETEPGEEKIVVLSRGLCFFSEKIEQGQLAGYDVVVIGNNHEGAAGGEAPDAPLCGSPGHEFEPTASAICIGHRAMHLIFNDEPEYEPVVGESPDLPPIGTIGEKIRGAAVFDAWGYLNQYDYRTGEFIDFYAPRETLNSKNAFGKGALSVHEIETDQRRGVNLGYLAWYAAGLKVVKFGPNGIKELGTYRHRRGNDFWGVSLIPQAQRRPLIVMSDRDYGLWIFKYTGRQ